MIRIDEIINGLQVDIHFYGRLKSSSLQSLKLACQNHLKKNRKICIHFEELKYIDQDGMDYLKKIKSKVELAGLPEFLRMEIEDSET